MIKFKRSDLQYKDYRPIKRNYSKGKTLEERIAYLEHEDKKSDLTFYTHGFKIDKLMILVNSLTEINDRELVNIIIGYSPPSPFDDSSYNKYQELSHFSGNQHNPKWDWNEQDVSNLSKEEKYKLLKYLRDRFEYNKNKGE